MQIEDSDTCGISIVILNGSQTAQNKAKELIEDMLRDPPSPLRAVTKKEENNFYGLQRYVSFISSF